MQQYWYQKPLRMIQTVLRETDIIDYDAKGVVGYLKKMHANSIIVNAGGIVDFFRSGLPGANLNPFMKEGQDILKDLIDECHANDIAVICRIDFRGAEKHFYRAHPDWFAMNEDGSPKMMGAISTLNRATETVLYTPCYNSRYMNDHAVDFLHSLFNQYHVDGIWENAVSVPSGVCYCERCKAKYLREVGKKLPTAKDLQDPFIYEEYRQWKYKCAEEHISRLRGTVKSYGEDRAFVAEIFGFFTHRDHDQIAVVDLPMGQRNFDFFVTPAFVSQQSEPQSYPTGLSYAGSMIKYMKTLSPEKQAIHLFGSNGGTVRYVREPEIENKIQVWESVAAGGGLWNNLFNGQHPGATHDTRGAYLEEPCYRFLIENKDILAENGPVAEIALYASDPSMNVHGSLNPKEDRVLLGMKGFERVLYENHLQFVHQPTTGLSVEALRRFKAVILPNSACMSDREVEIFRTYVEEGGCLISTFETSLYDENGRKRDNFALADVFGVRSTGMKVDTLTDCYQLIRSFDSPIMKDIENTILLANGETTLLVNAEEGTESVTTYVPIIHNQPPEKAWIRDFHTDYPVIAVNRFGKGKSIYFANMIGRALHNYAHDDFVQVMKNVFDDILPDKVVTTNAPASVHVTVIEVGGKGSGKYMVSLVNATGTTYRPIHEIVPVHDICVELHEGAFADGRVLFGEEGAGVEASEGGTVISIPVLKEFASFLVETK